MLVRVISAEVWWCASQIVNLNTLYPRTFCFVNFESANAAKVCFVCIINTAGFRNELQPYHRIR